MVQIENWCAQQSQLELRNSPEAQHGQIQVKSEEKQYFHKKKISNF